MSLCPICQLNDAVVRHHLIPKSQGGTTRKLICVACHHGAHQLLTTEELKQECPTVEALCAHPRLQRWVRWIRRQGKLVQCGSRVYRQAKGEHHTVYEELKLPTRRKQKRRRTERKCVEQPATQGETSGPFLSVIVDASLGEKGPAGLGISLRDVNGAEVACYSIPVARVTSTEAEFQAAIRGAQLARGHGAARIVIYSDLETLTRTERPVSERLLPLREALLAELARFEGAAVRLVRRKKNNRAHELARDAAQGVKRAEGVSWESALPLDAGARGGVE